MPKINTAEILCVGTELLLGDIVNTNAAFLSQRLADLGISVYRHTVVGDNPSRLRLALCTALEDSDLVITSGGLGPTYDDLTKETISEALGLPLEMNEEALKKIQAYFQKTGRVMTENNKKQAMIPRGARVLENNYGTAPAVAITDEVRGKTVIMLPGPPNELMPIFNEQVAPFLRSQSDYVLISKNIHIFGIGESAVEEKIKDIMTTSENPTVAPYCKAGEVRLRVTAKADSHEHAEQMCNIMVKHITDSEIGQFIYGIDCNSLERALVDILKEKHMSISTAESCTGGLIAKRITDISGCSEVFFGGAVTYTNTIKQKLLGVNEQTLETLGAVSSETAMQMARGARLALGTDIAVSATGLAGPGGGTPELPVGTVFIGVSTKNGEYFKKLNLSGMRSREYLRTVSASHALYLAIEAAKAL